MIRIVKRIEKVFMERMYILQAWKSVEYSRELFHKGFRGEFDLSSVEGSYPADLEPWPNLSW